jgi:ComF family protein
MRAYPPMTVARLQSLLDLLFPPRCVGCRRRGAWLCAGCLQAAPRLATERCPYCASPTLDGGSCSRCRQAPPAFDQLHCGWVFDGAIRAGIHALKYAGARHLATPLATAALGAAPPNGHYDAVVPVPLHPARQAQRGYNQSALLAAVVARRLGTSTVEGSLLRIRDTPAQVGLPAAARWRNLQGAFAVGDRRLAGARVLLVDDVSTTTSTLRAAGDALRAGGVTHIDAMVVARAT